MGILKKYYLGSLGLFAVVFFVWGMFYIYTTGFIRSSTQTQLDRTAEQITDALDDEFAGMEQLAFTLSQNGTVGHFVSQNDIREYFSGASEVNELLSSSISRQSLIDSVISFNQEGVFYRFRGTEGNTTCTHIFYLLEEGNAGEPFVVNTEDSKLIGYASSINDYDGTKIGSIVILADEEAILTRLLYYDQSETLHVSLVLKDEVVVSDTPDFLGLNAGEIQDDSYYYIHKNIGVTPLSILVTADKGYLSASSLYFSVAALITGLVLALLLILFTALIRKGFFQPMLQVLKSVDTLDLNLPPNAIPYVKSAEFDKLVAKLNQMLEKINTKNKGIQKAQLLIKNTEIKKQKAVIYSLKKQINAHFTVNILNIIKILISKKDLERAAELCDGLSMLVRYAHDEDEFINAWDEFYILQNYINIMNIRYDNKFQPVFELDDRLMDYRIPRMLLQPIVENAIIHGYKNQRKDCVIEITAKVAQERILIHIRDYGEGMSAEALDSLCMWFVGSGEESETAGGIKNIALININRRIDYYYGDDCGLTFYPATPNGTDVEIKLGTNPNIYTR